MLYLSTTFLTIHALFTITLFSSNRCSYIELSSTLPNLLMIRKLLSYNFDAYIKQTQHKVQKFNYYLMEFLYVCYRLAVTHDGPCIILSKELTYFLHILCFNARLSLSVTEAFTATGGPVQTHNKINLFLNSVTVYNCNLI